MSAPKSKQQSLILRVPTEERAREVAKRCTERNLHFVIGIEADKSEDISDLDDAIHTQAWGGATAGRNERCPCGSGKKFKKCCLLKSIIMPASDAEESNDDQTEDSRLIELLFQKSDRLPRNAVSVFVRRGTRIIPNLWNVVSEEGNWSTEEGFWATIHATHILGAIGGTESVLPLMTSLRMAVSNDCDWLMESFPSIFGSVGPVALPALLTMAEDRSNDWYTRIVALQGMAAITLHAPGFKDNVFATIAHWMDNKTEEYLLRDLAGCILLDFQVTRYRGALLSFAEEQEMLAEDHSVDCVHFEKSDVARAFDAESPAIDLYTRDWLRFYDADAIAARQARWAQERRSDKWYRRFFRWIVSPVTNWLTLRRINRDFAQMKKEETV